MSTNVDTLSRDASVRAEAERTRPKESPKTDFNKVLTNTAATRTPTAQQLTQARQSTQTRASSVLSAATTGVRTLKAKASASTSSTSSTSTTTDSSSTSTDSTTTDSSTILMEETKKMQELNQSFNLQYLQLQEKMQADNREYTSLSNIAKTKHDTAKNSISNVR